MIGQFVGRLVSLPFKIFFPLYLFVLFLSFFNSFAFYLLIFYLHFLPYMYPSLLYLPIISILSYPRILTFSILSLSSLSPSYLCILPFSIFSISIISIYPSLLYLLYLHPIYVSFPSVSFLYPYPIYVSLPFLSSTSPSYLCIFPFSFFYIPILSMYPL